MSEFLGAVDRQWIFAWPWPWWATALFALTVLAAIGYAYRRDRGLAPPRRHLLAGLRAASFLVLAVMLGGVAIQRFEAVLPDLLVLVDSSQSMAAPADRDSAGPSRIDAAKRLLADPRLQGHLNDHYRVRLYAIGERVRRIEEADPLGAEALERLGAEDPASRLGDALLQVASRHRGRAVAGAVLVSDGIVTEGRSLEDAAGEYLELPVFPVAVGSSWYEPDVAVVDVSADSPVLVGDRVEVRARVRTAGLPGRTVAVEVRREEDGRVLAATSVEGSADVQRHPIVLEITADEPGAQRLELVAPAQPEENDATNNRMEFTVVARDEPIDVLLVQQRPSFEFRFLKQLLERAEGQGGAGEMLVRLTSVLQEGDPRYAAQDRTAARLPPVGREELEAMDVVILSDADPAALGPVFLENLARAVTRTGTGLIVIAGPEHLPSALADTPLEPLLPIRLGAVRPAEALDGAPFRLEPTRFGRADPSLRLDEGGWAQVPPMHWLVPAPGVALGSRVLLQADGRADAEGQPLPVVVVRPAGAGVAWLQLTDESFRLAAGGNDLHERYWMQTVRWLARAKLLAEQEEMALTLPSEAVRVGEPIEVEVRAGAAWQGDSEEEVVVSVSGDAGVQRSVALPPDPLAPGLFRGRIEPLPPGRYRAVVARPSGSGDPAAGFFRVASPPSETDRLAADRAALQRLADATGGRMLPIEDAGRELPRALPRGEAVRLHPLDDRPLWNHPLLVGLLVVLLSLEWGLRRRWGLP